MGRAPPRRLPTSGTTSWAWAGARQRAGLDARIGAGDRDNTGHDHGKRRPADRSNGTGNTGKGKQLLEKATQASEGLTYRLAQRFVGLSAVARDSAPRPLRSARPTPHRKNL